MSAPGPAQHVLFAPFQTPTNQHHGPPYGFARHLNQSDWEAQSVAVISTIAIQQLRVDSLEAWTYASGGSLLPRHANILRIVAQPAGVRRHQ